MKNIIAKIQTETTNTVIAAIISAKNQIVYGECNIAPYYSEMEKWEEKEYRGVHADNMATLGNLSSYMMANESLYNELLHKYQMSVSVFIALLNND